MSSPAERFAAARQRAADATTHLAAFREGLPFELDPFQVEAARSLEQGRGVLVAAPTGAGKTVVGEFAAYLAIAQGVKCFYTTPIKALSNQKYADLVALHGARNVGLLTGDTSINGDAAIVVMTTEVLRNMLYAGSRALTDLRYVVMDEVHYLADRFRGAVWEEVIIHLPQSVLIASLSATVSNAEEFGEWMQSVRGSTDVVVSEMRPVPLWQHIMVGDRLFDLFTDDEQNRVNAELIRMARDAERIARIQGGRRRLAGHTSSRPEVISSLERAGLLPAITFIFSRAGCEQAVRQCLVQGLRLTDPIERQEIREYVETRCAGIPDEDLHILGYHDWLDALERGIAAHHAGMIPTFKEVVEELFQRGLVKAVFATETLALGINMPARSVVLERLVKWNGEAHVDVTPGEYTQLTGRAGRRGIDVEGHAVVLWQNDLDPQAVAGLASTRTYPLRSSFRPTYNMAINLVSRVGRERARTLLESSFAQFQADRGVVGLARQIAKNEEAMQGYLDAMQCHLGDFEEYAGFRRAIKEREQHLSRAGGASRKAEVAASLEQLKRGDIIAIPMGRRRGVAAVLDPGIGTGFDGLRPLVLTPDRQVVRLSVHDFSGPVQVVGAIRIPRTFDARSPRSRKELAVMLRAADVAEPIQQRRKSAAHDDNVLTDLRHQMKSHSCHSCPEREDHARWAERRERLERDTASLRQRVSTRTHVIAKTFDRVCAVLDELGYLHQDEVTSDGKRLSRLYAELDLVAAESIRRGTFDSLTGPELAGAVSMLIYESRGDDAVIPRTPPGNAADALGAMTRIWGELKGIEQAHGLDTLREPDIGFAWAAYRWASGVRLESVLQDAQITAGDFVRTAKQLIDLLEQIAGAAEGTPVAKRANEAMASVRRGVVAYSSLT
jgi:ATP-dependent RNA helicase HelY